MVPHNTQLKDLKNEYITLLHAMFSQWQVDVVSTGFRKSCVSKKVTFIHLSFAEY